MGLIGGIVRFLAGGGARQVGGAITDVTGAFRPNATRRMELGHDAFTAAQEAHAAEFRHARAGRFDALVNGLNRLPRPFLALGTMGLFVYAMADPVGFAERMGGLASVPEPLWWLLGAVVAFYFGARETHYLREHRPVAPPPARPAQAEPVAPRRPNPALADWRGEDREGGQSGDWQR